MKTEQLRTENYSEYLTGMLTENFGENICDKNQPNEEIMDEFISELMAKDGPRDPDNLEPETPPPKLREVECSLALDGTQ